MVGSSGFDCSLLGDGLDIVSCCPITSNYPCWSIFAVTVVTMAPMKLTIGPKAFATDGASDLPPCEKINNTIRLLLTLKTIMH
jgi:hypothetical protein